MSEQNGSSEPGSAPSTLPTPQPTPPTTPGDVFTSITNLILRGVFAGPERERWHAHVRRMVIGASGGLFNSFVATLVTNSAGSLGVFLMEPGARKSELVLGLFGSVIASAGSGAAAAWMSAQNGARMLFFIGILGPIIIKNVFYFNTSQLRSQFDPLSITSAYAQNDQGTPDGDCVGDSAFDKGFKAFMGIRQTYDKYAVVVASGKNRTDAQNKMKRILDEDPNLKLRVGPRACDNDFYPVFATEYLSFNDAKLILDKVKRLKSAPDAYLSPGPR